MTEPLSDRLLTAVGDQAALSIMRCLLERSRSQAELAGQLGLAQSTVSRAVRVLRDVGAVSEIDKGRAPQLGIDAPDEAKALLLATDRLAERIQALQGEAQEARSRETRQLVIKSAVLPHDELRSKTGDAES